MDKKREDIQMNKGKIIKEILQKIIIKDILKILKEIIILYEF